MSLAPGMHESWVWEPRFDGYLYTIRVEGSAWVYERIIEDNPSRLPAAILKFYHDDAAESYERYKARVA